MKYVTPYRDADGQPLDRGDLVSVFGFEGTFEVRNMRPEGVAVIMNTAPGYDYTSTVPLRLLTRMGGNSDGY